MERWVRCQRPHLPALFRVGQGPGLQPAPGSARLWPFLPSQGPPPRVPHRTHHPPHPQATSSADPKITQLKGGRLPLQAMWAQGPGLPTAGVPEAQPALSWLKSAWSTGRATGGEVGKGQPGWSGHRLGPTGSRDLSVSGGTPLGASLGVTTRENVGPHCHAGSLYQVHGVAKYRTPSQSP